MTLYLEDQNNDRGASDLSTSNGDLGDNDHTNGDGVFSMQPNSKETIEFHLLKEEPMIPTHNNSHKLTPSKCSRLRCKCPCPYRYPSLSRPDNPPPRAATKS
ncbi:hypothetical protein ACFX13_010107 [Malus domestica]